MAGVHVFSFFSHSAWLTNELSSGHSFPRHDCSQPRDVINTEGPSPGAWVLHFLMLIVIPLTTLRRGHTGLQSSICPSPKPKHRDATWEPLSYSVFLILVWWLSKYWTYSLLHSSFLLFLSSYLQLIDKRPLLVKPLTLFLLHLISVSKCHSCIPGDLYHLLL